MNYFLVTYNRRTGQHDVKQFGMERVNALRARFALEREHHGNPDIEIVVLGSDSLQTLEKTHPRYFRTLSDLTSPSF
jgi:hypothetical protein